MYEEDGVEESTNSNCRICLGTIQKTAIHISTTLGETSIANCINLIANVYVQVNDRHWQFLCPICHGELVRCLKFREAIEASDRILKEADEKFLPNFTFKTEIIEEPTFELETAFVKTNDNESDDDDDPDYEDEDDERDQKPDKLETIDVLEQSSSFIDEIPAASRYLGPGKRPPLLVTRCCMCGSKFPTNNDLLIHVKASHPDGAVPPGKTFSKKHKHKCEFCRRQFWQRTFLELHYFDLNFKEPSRNSFHSQSKKESRQKLIDQQGGDSDTAETSALLARHSPRKCCMCGEEFAKYSNLVEHAKKVHPEGRVPEGKQYTVKHRYECRLCHRKFWKRIFLLAHFEDVDYREPKRSEVENRVPSLKVKIVKKKEDKAPPKVQPQVTKALGIRKWLQTILKCCMCGIEFSQNKELVQHVKKVHPDGAVPNDKVFSRKHKHKCGYCLRKFWRRSFLMEHYADPNYSEPRRREMEPTKPAKKPKPPKPQKQFMCAQCGKICGSAKFLEIHEADVHSLEKNYACEICGIRFGHVTKLNSHMAQVHVEPNFM